MNLDSSRPLRRKWMLLFFAVGALALVSLIGAVGASGDASSDLAAAEQEEATAITKLKSAEAVAQKLEATSAPVEDKATQAKEAVKKAEDEAVSLSDEVRAERAQAKKEVIPATESYEDERSSKSATRTVGIVVLVLSLLSAALLFFFVRRGDWEPNRAAKAIAGGGLVVAAIVGVVLIASSSPPSAPTFSKETEELANAPKGSSTPEVEAAESKVADLEAEAEPLEARSQEVHETVSVVRGNVTRANGAVETAERKASKAEKTIVKAEEAENEEVEFREQAETIDYNQLIKNPDKYKGDKAVYEGQILQIQEEAGFGFMLLSVTNEGYGFWDDNIWVDFYEPIEAAEEDIITVYGRMTGSEEYETQIGGSTYVPKMDAVYVDE